MISVMLPPVPWPTSFRGPPSGAVFESCIPRVLSTGAFKGVLSTAAFEGVLSRGEHVMTIYVVCIQRVYSTCVFDVCIRRVYSRHASPGVASRALQGDPKVVPE